MAFGVAAAEAGGGGIWWLLDENTRGGVSTTGDRAGTGGAVRNHRAFQTPRHCSVWDPYTLVGTIPVEVAAY